MNQVDLAERIAMRAHVGQFRRDGVTPYSSHPAAVASLLKGCPEETIATAWLHDVLEDTEETAQSLCAAGVSEIVIRAVVSLTKKPGQSYEEYLAGVKDNPIARAVKVADMRHSLKDAPTDKQLAKYTKAIEFLTKGSTAPISVGTKVRKTGGSFQHTGTVVAFFSTTKAQLRLVLEFDAPTEGMLHIYRPDQVEVLP